MFKDKLYHFFVCLIAAVIHPMLAVGLAFGKEYGDSKAIGNKWDWYDILADVIGAMIGSGIHVIIRMIAMNGVRSFVVA